MLVPDRPFPPTLRPELERILGRVRPRLGVPAISSIIGQLREADDVVTVLRTSLDPASTGDRLDRLARGATRFRRELEATLAQGLLEDAKARLRHAADLEQRMIEGLEMLADLMTAARPRRRQPKGGRPRGGAALVPGVQAMAPRWFAANVVAVLHSHGAKPSQHQDGWFADVLRAALWPHVMRSELTGDIRRLLRFACLAD